MYRVKIHTPMTKVISIDIHQQNLSGCKNLYNRDPSVSTDDVHWKHTATHPALHVVEVDEAIPAVTLHVGRRLQPMGPGLQSHCFYLS